MRYINPLPLPFYNPDEPTAEKSVILGLHVATRNYCSPSAPVTILSSRSLTDMIADISTGTAHTAGDQIH